MSCRDWNRNGRIAVLLMVCLTVGAVSAMAGSHDKDAPKAKAAMTKVKAAPAAKTGEAVKTDAEHDIMMAEMMKFAAPSEAHEGLKKMVGTWKAVTKSWFAPGDPVVSEGVSENRAILGGRFIESEYKGSMFGQPFEGFGLTGYDNRKQIYNSFWIDNYTTSMMLASGKMDDEKKTLTFSASMDGPDGKPMETRMVTKIVDDNTHVFSMYGMAQGKEQLMMEITYTRM